MANLDELNKEKDELAGNLARVRAMLQTVSPAAHGAWEGIVEMYRTLLDAKTKEIEEVIAHQAIRHREENYLDTKVSGILSPLGQTLREAQEALGRCTEGRIAQSEVGLATLAARAKEEAFYRGEQWPAKDNHLQMDEVVDRINASLAKEGNDRARAIEDGTWPDVARLEKYAKDRSKYRHAPVLLSDGTVDHYCYMRMIGMDNSAIDHAIKKLTHAGKRGSKDKMQDWREAILSIQVALEIEEGNPT